MADELKKTGKVKFWNASAGFGFIKKEDGGEIFFHATKLQDKEWIPGQDETVEFLEATNKRGPEAREVSKV